MSEKGYNNRVYVNTGLLRDHVFKLREEKKLASRLYEYITIMKMVAGPMVAHQYDAVLRDIERMIKYFDAMADQLTRIDEEAVQLSHELGGIIVDSAELSRRITEKTFLL